MVAGGGYVKGVTAGLVSSSHAVPRMRLERIVVLGLCVYTAETLPCCFGACVHHPSVLSSIAGYPETAELQVPGGAESVKGAAHL